MWDEENDKTIKEAADQYHPAYDDKAWNKMEQMLDEHLPQKKDGRRIIFFLSLIMLLGVLTFLIVSDNRAKHLSEISQKTGSKSSLAKSPSVILPSTNSGEVEKIPHPSTGAAGNILPSEKKENDARRTMKNTGNLVSKSKIKIIFNTEIRNENIQQNFNEPVTVQQKNSPEQNIIVKSNRDSKIKLSEPDSSSQNGNLDKENTLINEKQENNTETKQANNDVVKNNLEIKGQEKFAKIKKIKDTSARGKVKNIKSGGFSNNFGISFSVGPGFSGVSLNNTGKMTITSGAGLSYSISPRFTIRTGFYVSKKIYSVRPADYRFPAGSNLDYLEKIDANCLVYDIPINVDYSFGKVKNHNWFVSTGLSSYLMKKETYEYYYKDPSGQMYNRERTIQNKNKHLLSVLNLSAGYQYNLNKRISLKAEPYVNVPLSGIGAGKVKFNSGGILFTITAKPF